MKPKKSKLTILAILTTLTILVWIFIDAFLRFKQTTLTSIPDNILAPLEPTVDSKLLDSLEKKRVYTNEEIAKFSPEGQSSQSGAIKVSTPSSSPGSQQ